MIAYYKTEAGRMVRQETLSPGCWVNMIQPDEQEIAAAAQALEIDPSFLRAALDEEEASRIEVEDGVTLLVVCNSLLL